MDIPTLWLNWPRGQFSENIFLTRVFLVRATWHLNNRWDVLGQPFAILRCFILMFPLNCLVICGHSPGPLLTVKQARCCSLGHLIQTTINSTTQDIFEFFIRARYCKCRASSPWQAGPPPVSCPVLTLTQGSTDLDWRTGWSVVVYRLSLNLCNSFLFVSLNWPTGPIQSWSCHVCLFVCVSVCVFGPLGAVFFKASH